MEWGDERGSKKIMDVIKECGIAIAFLEIKFGFSKNSTQHAMKI